MSPVLSIVNTNAAQLSLSLFQEDSFATMFHRLDLSMVAHTGMTWGDFFLGLLAVLISAVSSGNSLKSLLLSL
jgi:hypothetical protein